MNNPILSVKKLNVSYGKLPILRDLDFEIEKGDYVGIVGANGSGKTTLVRALLGLIPPTSGEIQFLRGKDTAIGYLPQRTLVNDSFFPAQVDEIVGTGLMGCLEGRQMKRAEKQQRIKDTLGLLNMEGFLKRKIGTLSIGQQQRVLLARALVSRPDLLILDEPTSSLDPKIREEFYEMLHHLHLKHQVTILQVSHDVSSMDLYMNKLLLMGFDEVLFGNYQDLKDSHGEHIHGLEHQMQGRSVK